MKHIIFKFLLPSILIGGLTKPATAITLSFSITNNNTFGNIDRTITGRIEFEPGTNLNVPTPTTFFPRALYYDSGPSVFVMPDRTNNILETTLRHGVPLGFNFVNGEFHSMANGVTTFVVVNDPESEMEIKTSAQWSNLIEFR